MAAALLLLYLLLPGYALAGWLLPRHRNLLSALALSYAFLVAWLLAGRLLTLPVGAWTVLYHAAIALLAAAALWRARDLHHRLARLPAAWRRAPGVPAALLGALLALLAYLVYARVYTEIPTDVWFHVARIRAQLEMLDGGRFLPIVGGYRLLNKWNDYGYFLPAYLMHLTGAPLPAGLGAVVVGATVLWLAAAHRFSLWLFQDLLPSRALRHGAALLAGFFLLVHLGYGGLAYLRNDVLSPGFFMYPVYLLVAWLAIDYLRGRAGTGALVIAAGLTGLAALVHLQEVLFIYLLVLLAAAYAVLPDLRARRAAGIPWTAALGAVPRRALWMLLALFGAYLALHLLGALTRSPYPPLEGGRIIPVERLVPSIRNLYILKPTGQFYQTVTLWGLWVYLLYWGCRRELRGSLFLRAGMALPLWTVFNPVFVDFFLYYVSPVVLWRVGLAIPLAWTGAYLAVRVFQFAWHSPLRRRWLLAAPALAGLAGFLLPYQGTYFENLYSRIYSLQRTPPQNGHRLWADLYEALDRLPAGQVLTDPVTGYTLNALTHQRYPGHKFYPAGDLPDLASETLGLADLRPYDGWWLVVNRRDGGPSLNGRLTGHWPEDVLQVSRRYGPALERLLRDHPNHFVPAWRGDRIAVYRIRL